MINADGSKLSPEIEIAQWRNECQYLDNERQRLQNSLEWQMEQTKKWEQRFIDLAMSLGKDFKKGDDAV